jgi:hypothetical protein
MDTWLPEIEQQLARVMDGLRWPFTTLTGLLLGSLVVGWLLWLRGRRARERMRFAQRRREEAEARRMEAEGRIAQARRSLGEHRVWTETPQLLTNEERQQLAAHQEQRSFQ